MIADPPAPPRIALTIAASDPSGGAGVQADLKTFAAFDVFGMAVPTALTVQNTMGVASVTPLAPAVVAASIRALFADCPPAAIKVGALGSREVAEAAWEALGDGPVVLDPVLVSTSGTTLGDASWFAHWWERVEVLTPNGPEAALLSGVDVQSADDAIRAGEALLARGVSAVLVKGGHHADEGRSVDMLVTAGGVRRFERARVPHDIHGTGCALSSAIAAGLAQGRPVEDAIERAFGWMTAAIAGARQTGGGRMVLGFGAAPPVDE